MSVSGAVSIQIYFRKCRKTILKIQKPCVQNFTKIQKIVLAVQFTPISKVKLVIVKYVDVNVAFRNSPK